MSQQFSFTWQNVSVTVTVKKKTFWKTTLKKKTIIDNGMYNYYKRQHNLSDGKNKFSVSGGSKSGSLFAIMGSSGSGKTTLLRAISGRCTEKAGILQINNTCICDANLRDISGYVPQQDIFTEYLTVLEHLKFMGALQIREKRASKHGSIINKLLTELNLKRHSFTLIKNLSGGEKRRLSLASELVSDPIILFCDEPTTGLDSYSSTVVVQKLQNIARAGKIVLVTIHQPSSPLFYYFDNVTLLAEGRLVVQGSQKELKRFFDSMNLLCPSNYNPADFYIKCLTYEDVPKMCAIFKESWKKVKRYCPHCDHVSDIVLEKKLQNDFMHQLKWLLWRNYLSVTRNKVMYLGGYLVVLVEIFAVAFFYAGISFFDKDSPQNIEGFLAFLGSEFTFTNMYSVVNVFPREVDVFIREKTLYSSSAYFSSKVISTIPLSFLSTTIYMSILFIIMKVMTGFYMWMQMTYLTFLISMAGCALGLAFSANFSTVEHIDLYLGPLEFLLLLLSGLMVKLDNIPLLFSWLKYLSPFYYAFDSLSNILWKDVTKLGNCTENKTIPCYSNGTEVLKNYGIYKTYDTVTYDVVYLHILITLFWLIGFVGILRKKLMYSI